MSIFGLQSDASSMHVKDALPPQPVKPLVVIFRRHAVIATVALTTEGAPLRR
jgi:hypothetical protein